MGDEPLVTPFTWWFLNLVLPGWCFLIGGCVGSFLNVVAYRLPRGMSLNRPGSRCPSCQRPILPRDNVPILSWWILRGRCRYCQAAISPRYMVVECTLAVTFFLLGRMELVTGGANLPGWSAGHGSEIPWVLQIPCPAIEITLVHGLLFAFLMTLVLLRDEPGPWNTRIAWLGVLAGVVAAGMIPGGHPAALFDSVGRIAAIADSLLGAGLAWMLGRFIVKGESSQEPHLLAMVGAFLGWQAVLVVAVATSLMGTADWLRPASPWAIYVAALVQVLFWRQIQPWMTWPFFTMIALVVIAQYWLQGRGINKVGEMDDEPTLLDVDR